MTMLRSRLAIALTATAALAMTATPALARGYGGWHGGYGHGHGHRHHGGGIDGGDLLAGLLIVGGVAAIATAASNSDRHRNDARDRDGGRYEDDGPGYDRGRDEAPVGARDQASGHFDDAVGVCTDEIEKGDRQVDLVDTVARGADRYSVTGRLSDGRGFACSVDDSGQVRSVAVDGHGII